MCAHSEKLIAEKLREKSQISLRNGGKLKPGDRIASVRELGADYQVNPNTVVRSYEKLTADCIIYNKRGIGYFIADDALETVLKQQRLEFIGQEVPRIRRRMELLGLKMSDIFD